ncbi:hypothetical protein BROC_00236 [Candidatus Brocadiaceae bacterium]|nr:hypothetical protein BROC_00236 [Candidatus Brocadiaceae bacterium]
MCKGYKSAVITRIDFVFMKNMELNEYIFCSTNHVIYIMIMF